MERAARLINKNLAREVLSGDDMARAVWPLAVGKRIAAHTSRIKLVRTTLVVEVEDAVWQKQLYTLTHQILERLQRVTGTDDIQDLEFRIAIPRRQPQQAEVLEDITHRRPNTASDDADEIADAVMRKIYRLSRAKATA